MVKRWNKNQFGCIDILIALNGVIVRRRFSRGAKKPPSSQGNDWTFSSLLTPMPVALWFALLTKSNLIRYVFTDNNRGYIYDK